MRPDSWKSRINFISRSLSLYGLENAFQLLTRIVNFADFALRIRPGQGERRGGIPRYLLRVFVSRTEVHRLPNSASDIRPSVHLPYVLARARSAEGGCAEWNLCRAGSVAALPSSPGSRALISVHPAPLLGGGRRAPSTHASCLESRFHHGGHFPRVVPRNPRAPRTLPTRPTRGVDNPARKLELLPSSLHLLRESQRIVTLSIDSVRRSIYRNSKIQFSFALQNFR